MKVTSIKFERQKNPTRTKFERPTNLARKHLKGQKNLTRKKFERPTNLARKFERPKNLTCKKISSYKKFEIIKT
jgi:hypothetical protein